MLPKPIFVLTSSFVDGDGRITKSDLGYILRQQGQNLTQPEMEEMIDSVDTSGQGYIEFPDFLTYMLKARHPEETETEEELREAFKVFDREGTGLISRSELKFVMSSLGVCLCKRALMNSGLIRTSISQGRT